MKTKIIFEIDTRLKNKFERVVKKLGYASMSEYLRTIIRSVAGLDK